MGNAGGIIKITGVDIYHCSCGCDYVVPSGSIAKVSAVDENDRPLGYRTINLEITVNIQSPVEIYEALQKLAGDRKHDS